MKLLVINLIALFIAMASSLIGIDPNLSYYEDSSDQLSSVESYTVEPLRTPNSQSSQDLELAAQSSTNLLSLIPTPDQGIVSFTYYLPIYAFSRAKEFFLLI